MTRLAPFTLLVAAVLVAASLAAVLLAVRGVGGESDPGAATGAVPVAAAPAATAAASPTTEPTLTPMATPAPAPAPAPSVEEKVEAAYLAYWDAYALAALWLDASLMEGFASGEELRRIRGEIASLRENGVALRVVVEHDLLVVVTSPESAVVVDQVTNGSFYVDAVSKQPPRAEGGGEILRDTVFMEKAGERWIATDSRREGPR